MVAAPATARSHPSSGAPLIAAGLAVIAVTYGLARYGYGLYLPQFRSAVGLSSGGAGVLAAGSYGGYCGAAVLAGRLVGAGRGRSTLWLAGGAAALGCLLVAVAWNGPSLAAGALIAGSGAGAATPALVAAVAATFAFFAGAELLLLSAGAAQPSAQARRSAPGRVGERPGARERMV